MQSVAQFPYRDALHHETKRDDQGCGLQWRENMKPDGGNQAEGKAGQPRHQCPSKIRREKNRNAQNAFVYRQSPRLGQRFCSRWFKADLCGPNFFRLRQSSEILCDRLQLFDRARAARAPKADCLFETVLNMVVDQCLLGLRNGLLSTACNCWATSRHGRCVSIVSMMPRK